MWTCIRAPACELVRWLKKLLAWSDSNGTPDVQAAMLKVAKAKIQSLDLTGRNCSSSTMKLVIEHALVHALMKSVSVR